MIATSIWESAAQPSILNGAEAIPYTATWLKRINTIQMNVIKWSIKSSKSSSTNIIRDVTQTLPIEIKAHQAAIRYWGKIQEMEQQRLPKIGYNHIRSMSIETSWTKYIDQIMETYNIPPYKPPYKTWKKAATSQMEAVYWTKHAETMDERNYYLYTPFLPPPSDAERDEYKNCWNALVNDTWSLTKTGTDKCPLCNGPNELSAHHILEECQFPAIKARRLILESITDHDADARRKHYQLTLHNPSKYPRAAATLEDIFRTWQDAAEKREKTKRKAITNKIKPKKRGKYSKNNTGKK